MPRRRRRRIPIEPVITEIEKLSHDGRGIARINDKTTFILGALPGETVEFQYTKQRSSFDEGRATQVLQNPSPDRATPACAHFGICGGCTLQHMSHEAQLKYKQATLAELLTHQAQITPEHWLPPLTADIWGYRRKARIGVKHVPKKEKVLVGFREYQGGLITDLHRCEVLHPSIGGIITEFSEMLMQLEARNQIPQIEIAIDDQESAIIVRHLTALTTPDLDILTAFCTQHQLRLYLQSKGIDTIKLHYPAQTSELLSYQIPAEDLTFQFHPTQFTQVNSEINRKMIQQAITLFELQADDRVLDLFCGIGNFSLPLAKHCAQVVGVEGDDGAVARATANATLNHITHAEFHSADLFQPQHDANWAQQTFDKILLDPPRCGAQEILDMLPQWQASRIIYVSCNPSTFARDAQLLKALGYTLSKVGIMDMFPHTKHVEVMGVFELT